MKTMYQFIKNRQFFKITLERDYQEKCVTVHTRYQVSVTKFAIIYRPATVCVEKFYIKI